MGDFDPVFVHALATQSWSLYGVGMFMILFRMYARIHRLGIKGLEIDDYLMVLAGCFYTILVVCLNVIAGGGGSNLYEPSLFSTFSPEDIKARIHGSKIVIVSEQAMLNVIYIIKASMLIMYTRLTLGHKVQRLVIYLAIYVLIGYLATQIAFFITCRPFTGYWALPPPSPQCATLQIYAIIQAIFNISSDALMLCIPLPLITRLHVPGRQKAVLLAIFGMGAFVITAAILTKVFNLSNVWDPGYMLWYTRESSVAVYVGNLPLIWPLLREWFPALPGSRVSTEGRNYALGSRRGMKAENNTRRSFGGIRGEEVMSGVVTVVTGKGDSMEELESGDEVDLVRGRKDGNWDHEEEMDGRKVEWDEGLKGGIHKSTTVEIVEEHIVPLRVPALAAFKAGHAESRPGSWSHDHDN